MPKRSVLGPLLIILYTTELFLTLENMLIGYADNSTLMAIVPSQGIVQSRVSPSSGLHALESLNRDLSKVSEWFDLWGIKLNSSKTMSMIVVVGKPLGRFPAKRWPADCAHLNCARHR